MSKGRRTCVVTNDDGVDSEGLRLLAAVAVSAGLDVIVAAPDGEASGSSAAMTAAAADGRVKVRRIDLPGLDGTPVYAVAAVPAFIAFTAVRGAFGPPPALVLAGINRGPNTGTAILHSGTVGAALTAADADVPAAAFSLAVMAGAGRAEWETAAEVAAQVLPVLASQQPGVVLNVNVPNVPRSELRGIQCGSLAPAGAVNLNLSRATDEYLQVTVHHNADEPPEGSDSALLAAGYATVTPVLGICETTCAGLPWRTGGDGKAREGPDDA
ncbi:MAG TPA: 5'/3'-nucleotidase SurE [Streptosporangiaceae bacterium]|nr:5'/3'-nucleotidase SurE [Streptosporangiaceae bacterium]